MELLKKIEILSAAAKYDVSCSSSGSARKNTPKGVGNACLGGICHSWSDDGRCISLLKILMTNYCVYNCAYCVNRHSNDTPRAILSPDEIAAVTVDFYRRNYIEGLFLSSAIIQSPDYTMELLLKTVRKLRCQCRFNGYIHLKAIPGADLALISEAGRYADRMSVNIELPSSESLKLLAPQKKKESIIKPMSFISSAIQARKEERKLFKSAGSFVPAGQSTQLIIGATPDSDLSILRLSDGLYRRFGLKRVYYSAYVPVGNHPNLPAAVKPPLLREHRLYQADWLLRFYGFRPDELLDENRSNFDTKLDPKSDWALRNLHLFPVEINAADYETLLRVPGIGVRTARRIVAARKVGLLNYDDLKKIGVVLKRARYFITCMGRYYGEKSMNEDIVRAGLVSGKPAKQAGNLKWEQISLFSSLPELPSPEVALASITGEF